MSSEVGNVSTGQVLAGLLRQGYSVLVPFGDGQRYDLAFDDNGLLRRVQVKTGRYRKGAVRFSTASVDRITAERKHYVGSIDFFGVYCPELNDTFLVPIEGLGVVEACLRIDASKNNQESRVRFACDYRI